MRDIMDGHNMCTESFAEKIHLFEITGILLFFIIFLSSMPIFSVRVPSVQYGRRHKIINEFISRTTGTG